MTNKAVVFEDATGETKEDFIDWLKRHGLTMHIARISNDPNSAYSHEAFVNLPIPRRWWNRIRFATHGRIAEKGFNPEHAAEKLAARLSSCTMVLRTTYGVEDIVQTPRLSLNTVRSLC